MLYLDYTIEIQTGGSYTGNRSWNKKRSEIDNCFKIYYITEGELVLCDKEQEYVLQKGGLYFINGSKLTSQYCNNAFSTYWLHFVPKKLILHQGLLSMPLIAQLPQNFFYGMSPLEQIDLLLFGEKTLPYKEYCIRSLQLQNFIQLMIIHLLEQSAWVPSSEMLSIQIIEPSIRYIDAHFTETIKLEQLASLCRMSPNYFHRIFTHTLHTTPGNYIIRLRMNAALSLLRNNRLSIKEIAYQLGYCHDAYFSRMFKKYYGVTPGQYKKKEREFLF